MVRLAVLLIVIVAANSCAESSHIDAAVAAAGQRAEVAEMTALVPPAGVHCPFDDAGWAAVQAHVRDTISAAFAEPALSRELSTLLRPSMREVCWLAGGVDLYEPSHTTAYSDHATLTARVGIWDRVQPSAGERASEPHNQLDITFWLVHSNGTWLVSDVKGHFVPGHGP